MVSAYTESGEMVLFMCAQQIHFVFIPNKRNHTLDHYCRMFLNRLFPLHTFIASNYRIFLKCHCISFMFSVFFFVDTQVTWEFSLCRKLLAYIHSNVGLEKFHPESYDFIEKVCNALYQCRISRMLWL